jgi:hypothetical protein
LQEQSAIQDPPRWGQGQENQAIRASLEKEHRKGGPVSVCLFLLRIGFSLKIWANKKTAAASPRFLFALLPA